MKIKVKLVNGREHVKEAMLATQGKRIVTLGLSDDAFTVQLLGEHSTLEAMVFTILIDGCTEREHTHIVRHEEIGKYVSTSRPDCSDGTAFNSRLILLRIPADRMIAIMRQRLCGAAWKGTRVIFNEVRRQIYEIDPTLWAFLVAPCVHTGYCTEVRSSCLYLGTPRYNEERNRIIRESVRLKIASHPRPEE